MQNPCSAVFCSPTHHLWLRDVNRLAGHADATQDEEANNRVKLEYRPCCPRSQRYILQRPALTDPVCHERSYGERSRNRRAFKVLALARSVLGNVGDGDVEAREACKPAEDEEGQEEVVDRCAEAYGKG